jgi:molybdopterin-guanine dinucleotide biosynthesis protein MobB
MRAVIVILSDKGISSESVDESGQALRYWLAGQKIEATIFEVNPDDLETIEKVLIDWCDHSVVDLIITCGGAGAASHDVTSEATRTVIEKQLPGFAELVRNKRLKVTPMTVLSRATAGTRNGCLILNLPGSPKDALVNLSFVWPAIRPGIAKIKGDASVCSGINQVNDRPLVISFAGYSGSGKTTLVEKVIHLLSEQGFKVGAIKHDGHHFDIDKEGKDSWRMTQAGTVVTVITDSNKLAVVKQHDAVPAPEEIVDSYFSLVDIVIIEGWKEVAPNKIEVFRADHGREPLCVQSRDDFIALATNADIATPLPKLDIDNPYDVVDFILEKLSRRQIYGELQ